MGMLKEDQTRTITSWLNHTREVKKTLLWTDFHTLCCGWTLQPGLQRYPFWSKLGFLDKNDVFWDNPNNLSLKTSPPVGSPGGVFTHKRQSDIQNVNGISLSVKGYRYV